MGLFDNLFAPEPKSTVKLQQQTSPAENTYTLEQVIQITNALVQDWTTNNNPKKTHEEQVKFDRNVKDLHSIGRGASAIASLTGDPRLSQQIAVVTEHSVNVGFQIAGLLEFESLAAAGAVTPIGLGAALLSAAAAISEVFSRQEDPIQTMMIQIITQLSNQHQEILRKLDSLGIDLKLQIGEIGLKIVTGFAILGQKADNIQEKLNLIHKQAVSNSTQTKHTLNSVSKSLDTLKGMVTSQAANDVIAAISRPVNRIVYNGAGGYISSDVIRELVPELLTSVKLTSKRGEVAGVGSVPDPLPMSQWITSNQNAGFADYHINELLAIAKNLLPEARFTEMSLSNPSLWAYSVLALLILYRKEYSPNPEHRNRITGQELKNVEDVVHEGQAIQESLKQLRNPKLYAALLENLERSLNHFEALYQEDYSAFVTEQTALLQSDTHQTKTKISEAQTNELKYQSIEVNGLYHNWFLGISTFRGNGTQGYCSLTNGSSDSGYKVAAGALLDTFLKTQLAQITEQTALYLGRYGFIISPEPRFNGPSLPITKELANKIENVLPLAIREALNSNLGNLYFRYNIQGNEFHLMTYFEDKLCHRLVVPYEPLFYENHEAIWWYWVGGKIPIDSSCNRAYAFTGVGSTGKHFYDYTIDRPIVTIRESALTRISAEELEQDSLLAFDRRLKEANELGEERVGQKRKALRQQYNQEVCTHFKSDLDSPFGQAITAYFAAFKCLKSFLALCLHDEFEKTGSDLNQLLNTLDLPGSREEMVNYLQKNEKLSGLEIFEPAKAFFEIVKTHLPAILMQERPSYYAMVERVTEECMEFVRVYFPTKVAVNPVMPFNPDDDRQSMEDQIVEERAVNQELRDFIMALGGGIYGLQLTAEQTAALMADVQNRFAQRPQRGRLTNLAQSPAMLLAASRNHPIFGGAAAASDQDPPANNQLAHK